MKLIDPVLNVFEVLITKRDNKIHLSSRSEKLYDFYGLNEEGWLTMIYFNRNMFLMRVKNHLGEEIRYPNVKNSFLYTSIRLSDLMDMEIPVQIFFYHVLIKSLTTDDINGPRLVKF